MKTIIEKIIDRFFKRITIRYIIRKDLLRHVSDELFVKIVFLLLKREILSLRNPLTFSEKIQWIKIYGNLERYHGSVDKYEVRQFVADSVGEKHLIPLIGVWSTFDEIPFESLPDKFILKATHGSGYNYICHNKENLDRVHLKSIVDKWLSENFYKSTRETQYKACKPRIICEEFLEDDSGSLRDYKFFCFDGRPHMIQIDSDRYQYHRRDFMSMEWTKLPIRYIYPDSNLSIEKPSNLQEMVDMATLLSKQFAFVRVDLYSVNGRTYFGELTLTPESGLGNFYPKETDLHLGSLIDLKKYSVG